MTVVNDRQSASLRRARPDLSTEGDYKVEFCHCTLEKTLTAHENICILLMLGRYFCYPTRFVFLAAKYRNI